MRRCTSAAKYQAIKAPTCNAGNPCEACRDKWSERMRLNEYEKQMKNASPPIRTGAATSILHDGIAERYISIEVDEDHHVHMPVRELYDLALVVRAQEGNRREQSTEYGDLPDEYMHPDGYAGPAPHFIDRSLSSDLI